MVQHEEDDIEYVVERFKAGYSREDIVNELLYYNWKPKAANKALAAYDRAVAAGTIASAEVQAPAQHESSGSEFGQFIGKTFYVIGQVLGWAFNIISAIVVGWMVGVAINKVIDKFND